MLPGLAIEGEIGSLDVSNGRNIDRGEAVCHIGDDLEAHPAAAVAGEFKAITAVLDDFPRVARVEDGHARIKKGNLRMSGEGRGLGDGIVARHSQDPAVSSYAGEVGVFEDIPRAVDSRTLPVPHPQHAVVFGFRHEVGELAAEDGCGPEVFVDPGHEHNLVAVEQLLVTSQQDVEPSQRRATIAGNEAGRVQPHPPVRPVLVQGNAHQGLQAAQDNAPLFLQELVVQ